MKQKLSSVVVVVALLLSGAAHAAKWVPFGEKTTTHVSPTVKWVPFGEDVATSAKPTVKKVPSFRIITSNSQKLEVEITIPGMKVNEVMQNNTTYHFLRIPQSGYTTEVGQPQVPMVSRLVAVPTGATVNRVHFLQGHFENLENYLVYPAQEPLPDIKGAPKPPFVSYWDRLPNVQGKGEFYPSKVVTFEGPHVIQKQSVIYLRLFPVQFNLKTRQVRVYSKIIVRILFEK